MEIEEVVRRWQVNESQRAIARATGLARETVKKYLAAAISRQRDYDFLRSVWVRLEEPALDGAWRLALRRSACALCWRMSKKRPWTKRAMACVRGASTSSVCPLTRCEVPFASDWDARAHRRGSWIPYLS
jgi:hypothetical protein